MAWFAKNKRIARNAYYTSQLAIITLSALTPILILKTDLPGWIQALPSALAAIAVATSNAFNWKENWIRRSSTLELLIAEKLKYETRTSSAYTPNVGDEQALNDFVEKVTALNLTEVSNWQKALSKGGEKNGE